MDLQTVKNLLERRKTLYSSAYKILAVNCSYETFCFIPRSVLTECYSLLYRQLLYAANPNSLLIGLK